MNNLSSEEHELRQDQKVGNISIDGQSNQVTLTFSQTQIIQIAVDEVKTRPLVITSPYKGLKKFESDDKDLFFGRDQFLTGLVNELEQTNLILLLGASGSGKSSVVRAGVIPWLVGKWGARFVNLTFTPDQDPFESLYAGLLSKYKQSEAQIARENKINTLTQVVKTLKQPDTQWLIFIDQFEELFTTSSAEKCKNFIDGLIQITRELSKANDSSVKIIGTMRADFLDRLSPYPALVKATDKHRPMISEMQPDELRLAIEQPAAHHGVVFENGLVEEIIKDVQGQPGYLPLLQYTLNLLWQTELQANSLDNRTLNISTYRNLGGVRGTLQKHVEQVYQALSKPEQLATQQIFLKLIGIGGDAESETEWKPVRRRANRSEFDNQLEQKMMAQLIDQNLLVSNREIQSQESTIEIVHEILLTSWTMLSNWIRENRLAISIRNRLNDDVKRWQTKKAEDELWNGLKLEQVLKLKKDPIFNQVLGGFNPEADEFIVTSEKRHNQQRHRKVALIVGFSTLALLSATLFVTLGTPFIAKLFNDWGFEEHEAKRFPSAIQKYTWSFMMKSDNNVAIFNRGRAYDDSKDFNAAEIDYKTSMATNPNLVSAYNNLARLYIVKWKDYHGAIEFLTRGLNFPKEKKLNEKEFQEYKNAEYAMLKNLGWAQFKLGDQNAETNLKKAIDLEHKRGAAHCLLAEVLKTKKPVIDPRNELQNCINFGNRKLPEEREWIDSAKEHLKM